MKNKSEISFGGGKPGFIVSVFVIHCCVTANLMVYAQVHIQSHSVCRLGVGIWVNWTLISDIPRAVEKCVCIQMLAGSFLPAFHHGCMTRALRFAGQRLKSLSLNDRFLRKHRDKRQKETGSDLPQMGLSLLVYTARGSLSPTGNGSTCQEESWPQPPIGAGKGLGMRTLLQL